jgi:cbb3-type cytochrome oxidase subunit 1
MRGIDALFLRTAVIYVLAGMSLGIFMALSDDHSQMPTHAHMNLLGWASMALYAVVYRVWPEAARSALAVWHFWIANLGTLVVVIGVAGIMAGHEQTFGPLAGVGAIVSLIGMLLFAAIVYTCVGVSRSPSRSVEPVGAAD